jgi:hypothetical protein
MRDALRETVWALAGDICDALRDVPEADWQLTLFAAYERLQATHDDLYTALGGRRMGDYAPDATKVKQEVVKVAVRLMLLVHTAERVGW